MKLNLLTILMLFVLFSCVNKTNNNLNSTIIDVEKKPDGAIEYESVTMTPIETIDDGLLGQDLKIRFTDSNIYIADAAHGCIFKYDKEGQFINRIGSKGKGPQEYLSLTDFRVKNDTVEIMSCVGDTTTNILRYYSNGEFISQSNYDVIAGAFDRLGVDYLFLKNYIKNDREYRLMLINKDGKVLNEFISNNPSIDLSIVENFSKSDSFLFYKEAFDNNIYTIEPDSAIVKYTVDFGKFSIPESVFSGDFYSNFENLNKRGFFIIRSFFENKHYAFFDLGFQNDVISEVHHLLYEKSTERIYKQKFIADETNYLYNVIGLTETDELVYLQNAYEVTTNRDALAKLNITNKTKLNEIEANDNPVILKCKIKNN